MQACHAAYDKIDETAVYTCTGNPQPKDIERVVQSMMSDEFGTSYSRKSLSSPLLDSPSSTTLPFSIRDIIFVPWLHGFTCLAAHVFGNSLMTVITSLKIERGLALQDMIAGAYDFLQTVELPNQSRIYLLDHLGQCE
jgi:replication factor C subunit 3/5